MTMFLTTIHDYHSTHNPHLLTSSLVRHSLILFWLLSLAVSLSSLCPNTLTNDTAVQDYS